MRRPSRRSVLVAAALVAALLIAANVAGLVRYPGGPLSEQDVDGPLWLDLRPGDAGGIAVGYSAGAGVEPGEPLYVGIDPRNQSSWTATIERVRLIGVTPGLQLVEARLALPGTPNRGLSLAKASEPFVESLRLLTEYQPIPADLAGNTSIADGRMWIEVVAEQPGEAAFKGVAIDYRIGPLSFTAVVHLAMAVCIVPMPDGAVCSWDAH